MDWFADDRWRLLSSALARCWTMKQSNLIGRLLGYTAAAVAEVAAERISRRIPQENRNHTIRCALSSGFKMDSGIVRDELDNEKWKGAHVDPREGWGGGVGGAGGSQSLRCEWIGKLACLLVESQHHTYHNKPKSNHLYQNI